MEKNNYLSPERGGKYCLSLSYRNLLKILQSCLDNARHFDSCPTLSDCQNYQDNITIK